MPSHDGAPPAKPAGSPRDHCEPHGDGVLPDAKRSTMNVETGSHSATMLRLSPHSP